MKRNWILHAWAVLPFRFMWLTVQDNSAILLAISLIAISQFFTISTGPDQQYQGVTMSHSDTLRPKSLDICKSPESLADRYKFAKTKSKQSISQVCEIPTELSFCFDSGQLNTNNRLR